MPLDSSLDLN